MAFSMVPLRRSVPGGVLAYLLNYAATYLLVAPRVDALLATTIDLPYTGEQTIAASLASAPPTWKVVGWVLHGAHRSPLLLAVRNRAGVHSVDLVSRLDGLAAALSVLPPIVLLATGFAVARWSRTPGPRGETLAGASVALGYVAACAAGGLLFTVGSPTTGPGLFTTIFLAGVGYPLFFGGLGGWIAEGLG